MRFLSKRTLPYASLLPLLFAGGGSAILYTLAVLHFPLLTYYARPFQNLGQLAGSEPSSSVMMAGWVLLLFAGYATGACAVAAAQRHPLAPRLIAAFAVLFSVLLLLVQPATSSDLYDYLFRGRMITRYAANTFTHTPRDFGYDPLFRFVAWPEAVTAYGPLWEGVSWLTAWLAGETAGVSRLSAASAAADLLKLLLAYKLLAMLGFLLCGAAIWAALGQIAAEQRPLGLYLWLWNPLALWESIAAGHNDAWMVLSIVVAIGAMQHGYRLPERARIWAQARFNAWAPRKAARGFARSRFVSPLVLSSSAATLPTQFPAALPLHASARPAPSAPAAQQRETIVLLALLTLTFGGLIKYLPLFLCPILLAAALRHLPTWGYRWRSVFLGGLLCGMLIATAYAPFWDGWETLRNFSDRRSIFTISGLAALQVLLVDAGAATEQAQTMAAIVGLGLVILGAGWAAWRAWRKPEAVAAHAVWFLLWFILLCNPAPQPWYMLWPLGVAALQPWRTRLALGVTLGSCAAMLVYVAISWVVSVWR